MTLPRLSMAAFTGPRARNRLCFASFGGKGMAGWVIAAVVLGFGLWLGLSAWRGSAMASPAGVQTAVLQQGLNGYSGVEDAWVSSNDWDNPPQYSENYGQNEILSLERDGGDNPLLRFDLSSIPANSEIIAATLELYNTTPACNISHCAAPPVRRIKLYRVLKDWDEGNQVDSPIDAAGKHGVTGDNAFDYYPGEGTDIPWGARGMEAGVDYAAAETSAADVADPGWYAWDVTALVRAWVRGDQPNYGLVLRDASGWSQENTDWRHFWSSQYGGDPSLRPKLTITYNPDAPYADAGSDQANLQWDGSAITLDGSGSHDRPGGNDASLTYQWRILTPAFDSAQSGVIGSQAVIAFTPDVPGEWTFELTVTNDLGETATDTVFVRLLTIPAGHPRVFLTPAKLAALRARATADNPRWTQLKAEADGNADAMLHKALVSQVLNDASYCTDALALAQADVDADEDCASCPGDVALVFDWCYDQMSQAQKDDFIAYFNHRGDNPSYGDDPGWGNYWPRHGYSYAVMGLATYGDNPRAGEWLDVYRYQHAGLDLLDRIAAGGGWPEGMIYDWIANYGRVQAVAAWETAAGERLFAGSDWFRERIGYLLLHHWPGVAQEWGRTYHPYLSTGDTERNRGSMANYGRIMALILADRFPNHPLAPQLAAYLAAEPDGRSDDFLAHQEFLWFNPDLAQAAPTQRAHVAAGTGTLFLRSDWPDGARDADARVTYIGFQAGNYFSYHQHLDQNSITLFKYSDLLLDSGVYSGDGLSYHDRNYYMRTIAHNTLIVYNPSEDFSHARPGAASNDGGQRSMYPASRAPQTIAYYDRHLTQYDVADMLRYEDTPQYAYALGDAAKAYNNPIYNQAMDGLSGNTAKVSRFQRELLYLRPVDGDSRNRDYVVLYDRVGVTDPAFSGENTKLLFHTFTEPTLNGSASAVSPGETLYSGGDEATVVNGDGKLFMRFLLPETVNLRKVGGRGEKAFWVFDANYDWHWNASEAQPRPTNDFEDAPYGEWRIELEPADAGLEHNFLTVMHPASSAATSMPATTVIQASGLAGVHIADPDLGRVALFSAAADGAPPTGALSYTYPSTGETLNILLDLTPGQRYDLAVEQANGETTVRLIPSSSGGRQVDDQGALSFTVTQQSADNVITFSRDNNRVYRIAAHPNAAPEDVSAALDALSPGTEDHLLNISPNGQWLVLETDRFGCSGWPCLAVVKADYSSGGAVTIGGQAVHPEGSISAVSNDGNLVVFASQDGPHDTDLYASVRSGGVWGAATLLTGASPYRWHSMPALSDAGDKVLFDCDNSQSDVGEAICEAHTDGTGFRVVLTPADGPGPHYNPLHSPDYAPDGGIVFEGDWDGETVWRLPAGATAPEKVGGYNNDNSPCVLPDGSIVSLWMDRPGGPSVHELKVMRPDGSSYFMALTGVDIYDVGLGCGGTRTNLLYLPVIISAPTATTARLSWTADASYSSYAIWRNAAPYFSPAGAPLATVVPPPNAYDDAGALGSPGARYYLVEGRPAAGGSLHSRRLGAFNFSLTPGAP